MTQIKVTGTHAVLTYTGVPPKNGGTASRQGGKRFMNSISLPKNS